MRHFFLLVLCSLLVGPARAQQSAAEARLRAQVPYATLKAQLPSLTPEQYDLVVRMAAQADTTTAAPSRPKPEFLGQLSANRYAPNSTANPYGAYGSQYTPKSVTNPYGDYGSPFTPNSVSNPNATNTPKLYAQDGQYLGKLSSNPYDPESVSNPYGRYGSPYSPISIKNPYSPYGSRYSPLSPTNPYTTQAPSILHNK